MSLNTVLIIVTTTLIYTVLNMDYPIHCSEIVEVRKSKSASSNEVMRVEYIDPYINCSTFFVARRSISYTNHPTSRDSYNFPLTSACLRCAICIAIAEKLNETLVLTHEALCVNQKIDDVAVLLRSLCSHGFENYGLRKFSSFHLITDSLLVTEHVPNYLDGKWTEKLRTVCHFYLNEYGEDRLYKTWLEGDEYPKHDMINTICRSNSVFRDCLNIEDYIITQKKPPRTFYSSKKVAKQFRIVCP